MLFLFCNASGLYTLLLKVRRALPLIPPMAMTVGNLRADGGAVEGARAYLEKVEAYRSANFPSSEEQDGELLR